MRNNPRPSIRVGVLTSSRADFGIYLPLLHALKESEEFELKLIAFGTHLSRYHGYTLTQIEAEGFHVDFKIESLLLTDSAASTASSAGLTNLKFADFWNEHRDEFDIVFCLGDRFEMYAAVLAGVPFGIKFAHIHGGETTLGAIDNVYRHCISLASSLHFTSTESYAKRVAEIIGSNKNVVNVGSLSLENLLRLDLMSTDQFSEKFGIDMDIPSILITYHPETAGQVKIEKQTNEIIEAFLVLAESFQLIITMPNADTFGSYIREQYAIKLGGNNKVFLRENFGTLGYFSAMKHAKLVLGNSSSGIIEAASFGKYVVNIGSRQEGRYCSENIIHVPANSKAIIASVADALKKDIFESENVYSKKGTTKNISQEIKHFFK